MAPINSATTPQSQAARSRHARYSGTGTVDRILAPVLSNSLDQSHSPVPVPPSPSAQGQAMPGHWPLQDFIELGALPGAVPCARLHVRAVLWEWGLTALIDNTELVLSEIVTNAIGASSSLKSIPPVRVWLHADSARVLVLVWDGNPQSPVRIDPGEDAECGRGLLLVETISSRWGTYATPRLGGKAVWALIEETEG